MESLWTVGVVLSGLLVVALGAWLVTERLGGDDPEYIEEYRMETRREAKT